MSSSVIRSEQRIATTVAALIFGPLLMAGPLALGLWLSLNLDFTYRSPLILAFTAAASAFISYQILQNYHWVELDGDVLRARRFWTRRLVERNIREIDQILPLTPAVRNAGTAMADRLLGPNRGYAITFKVGGPKITLLRGDMTNVDELAQAVMARVPVNA